MPDPAPRHLLAEAWSALVGEHGPPPPALRDEAVTGPSGGLPSAFRVEDTAVACVAAALGAAAELSRSRGGSLPVIGLDREHVAAAVRSERYFRVGGGGGGMGFAPLSRFWPTADGWVRTHANYPWHRAALLAALGTGEDPDVVAAVMRSLPAGEVEERVFAAGGVAATVRSADAWSQHPQGGAVASEPLIGHEAIGEAPPPARNGGGDRPASGVRVLDLTRVIAGPVCTRFLGALGADVLRVDPPGRPDLPRAAPADTLLGKRSAVLDLADADQRRRLDALLDSAHAVVCGYRPGALDRFGLGAHDLAARSRGLVVVYLDAWGHSGPWSGRRGFDSVVQAASGIAVGESGGQVPAPDGAGPADGKPVPGALPCQLLDHGTGYLAAAAVLDGLRRQAEGHGGTHVRRLSLARTAAWLAGHPADPEASRERSTTPGGGGGSDAVVRFRDGPDEIEAVAPPGALDGTPLRWPGAPARYGTDPPAWSGG